MGTRGVPPRYGGFETFAAELGTRLAARGHEVSVYCRDRAGAATSAADSRRPPAQAPRSARGDRDWNGIHRIVLPAIRHKYFETVSHTFLSAIDALFRGFDAILLCNAANAFVLPLLRAVRIPVAINVDGIERRRRKWNVLGRAVYAAGETFSARFASAVVADAEVIAAYYRERHGAEPVVIRYGAEFPAEADSDVLARLGLEPRNYILYVSRFEPENNPLEVVESYLRPAPCALPPLVMVGDALYAHELKTALLRRASAKILFPGAIYGLDYRTLQRNALLYIQATEVGGTHPALIEAMGSGGAVVALDTPENREVGGDAVGYFRLRPDSLSGILCEWLADAGVREAMRERARRRAAAEFGWDAVTDAYEQLFRNIS